MKKSGQTNNLNFLQRFAVRSSTNQSSQNRRAVIYNRCSSLKQDTLEQQDGECISLCKQHNFEIIKTYLVKESAETDDRKVFQEMLKFCEVENIGHIVVYNYDRFTRSGDVGLLKKLRDDGIRVHSVRQQVDDETSSGQFSQSLYVLFAKLENDQRRDRIILGQKTKIRKGEWIGRAPLGYKKGFPNGEKKHILEKPQCFINEDGIKLRQAFYWKDLEKITNLEIIERLGKMGLTVTPAQLTRIFRNPFYCGYIACTYLDDGEIIRGKHEPLISEELFLKVNGIVNENPHGWSVGSRNEDTPLKATVHCGKCKRPLTAYAQKQYLYYKCPNRGCSVNIRNLMLHDLFTAELSRLTVAETLKPVVVAQLEATYWMLHNSDAARIKPMKDELTRLKNELEQMELNHVTNKISQELFMKHSGAHKQKIKEIEINIDKLCQDSSNLDKMLKDAADLSCNLLKTWQMCGYEGKLRLQKLIFPEGLSYTRENHTLRTPKINPVLFAIASISENNGNSEFGCTLSEDEKLHQLYLMFSSSNFFMECLSELNLQFIDFKTSYQFINLTVQFSTNFTESVIYRKNETDYSSGITETRFYLPENCQGGLELGQALLSSGGLLIGPISGQTPQNICS